MEIRIARHTDRLDDVVRFYRDELGLPEIGRFEDHDGYDGVLLGVPGTSAHLEFTSGGGHDAPTPHPETLLALYVGSAEAVDAMRARIATEPVEPSNPWWHSHGLTFADPDGFHVVLVPASGPGHVSAEPARGDAGTSAAPTGTSTTSAPREMLTGFVATQLLSIAARLGVADLLGEGPRSAAQLAEDTQTHAPSLYRFLRALTTFDVFRELDGERFENTALSERLRTDAPGSIRNSAADVGDVSYRVWGDALHTLRTGEPAAQRVLGMRAWEYRAQHREAGEIFNRAMGESAVRRAQTLLDWPWEGDELVVDVGGGDGTLLIELLRRHAGLRGIVFDLPHSAREAEQTIRRAALDGRCEALAGSFLETLPAGDVYVFSAVLSDWPDDEVISILRRTRKAMSDAGHALIIEMLIPETPEPHPSKVADVYLLVAEGGRVRTAGEWRAILEQADFTVTVNASDGWSLLDARPWTSRARL